MRASAEAVRDLRRGAAEALRADRVDIEEWEIAVLHRAHPAGDGACARVTWVETPDGNLDRVIDAFRMDLMPRMEELPGFCSVSLMVDRMTGRAAAAVTYADRDALMRSRDMGSAMREDFSRSVGATITEVAEFDVVLAHLRVPEMA